MENLAKRLETLRTQKNISRIQLAATMGFPRTSIEKFEMGKLTPTKEQQAKLASYFGVSVEYLRGETDDGTTMTDWLAGNVPDEPVAKPAKTVYEPKIVAQAGKNKGAEDGAVFNSLLRSETFKKAVLDVLKTPEGKKLVKEIMNSK